ncbi:hypothetical protein LM7420_280036 [Listeria monocytogenes]|nr:hypothetical protein LM7420_280036 [Listeria monocytogenes]CUL46462.1 hypothetical protein LM7421_280036 [Listeria monocytogenes]CUL47312.1 hypothetical protein LM7422_250036 [Listeria monocytogenes]
MDGTIYKKYKKGDNIMSKKNVKNFYVHSTIYDTFNSLKCKCLYEIRLFAE